MPTHKVKGGYQWGSQKVYPTKAQADKQAAAIFANGYRGDARKEWDKIAKSTDTCPDSE